MSKQVLLQALKALSNGQMIILQDNQDRENEGDLVIAAEFADAQAINFMINQARGIVCLSLDAYYFDKMQIPMQPKRHTDLLSAPFGVSIEARSGVTTGVSAADRSQTIATVLDHNSGPDTIAMPGHVFPLKASTNGVLARAGHTEGSIDLMQMAGLQKAAVICEIMNDDGSMCRGQDLINFAQQHQLPLVSIQDIINNRLQSENPVQHQVQTVIPTQHYGDLYVDIYLDTISQQEALCIHPQKKVISHNPLVRIHSSCMTGDLLGSLRCDCGSQLHQALQKITTDHGLVIYLEQEGRGIGLVNKLKAYALQDQGLDTVEANQALGQPIDARDYQVAGNILRQLGVQQVRLLTNNPKKIRALETQGFEVARQALEVSANNCNLDYLKTKKSKLGHHLSMENLS